MFSRVLFLFGATIGVVVNVHFRKLLSSRVVADHFAEWSILDCQQDWGLVCLSGWFRHVRASSCEWVFTLDGCD